MLRVKQIFLILLMAIPITSALARPSGSTSHSFSRGFSSSAPSRASSSSASRPSVMPSAPMSRPAAPPAARTAAQASPASRTSFGGFGSGKPPAATPSVTALPPSTSALSNSLTRSASQDKALSTLDSRTAASSAAAAPQPRAYSTPTPSYTPGAYTQQATQVAQAPLPAVQHTTIINNNGGGSSGFSSGLTGFMLGSLMSNHHNDRPYASNGYSGAGGISGSSVSPNTVNGSDSWATPAPKESTGTTILRVIAWLALLSALGAGGWYLVKYFTKPAAPKPHRYTL